MAGHLGPPLSRQWELAGFPRVIARDLAAAVAVARTRESLRRKCLEHAVGRCVPNEALIRVATIAVAPV